MPTAKSKSSRSAKAGSSGHVLNVDELFAEESDRSGSSSAEAAAKTPPRRSIRTARKSAAKPSKPSAATEPTPDKRTAKKTAKEPPKSTAKAASKEPLKKDAPKKAPKETSKSASARPASKTDGKTASRRTEKTRRTLRSVAAARPRPKGYTFVPVTDNVPETFIDRISAFFKPLKHFLTRGPLLILTLVLLLLWMFVEANVLQLKSAEVTVRDLPYSFRGTKILYISDLHLSTLNSPGKVSAMIAEIMRLEPDLLLLGGDYTASPLISGTPSNQLRMRNMFFRELAQYNPPLGKYAVAGDFDNRLDSTFDGNMLRESMALGGVTLLQNEAAYLQRDNQYIILIGADDWASGEKSLAKLTAMVSASDCVILLCHNPEAVPTINSHAAYDGFWVDLALCGHTHGGYLSLGSYEPFNPTRDPDRFSAGWHRENTAKVLISRGAANPLLPMRFLTPPEAHLITLK